MASLRTERILSVNHWSDRLFSFRTTRDPAFRFENGHFVMLGIDLGGKPLLRAYSIASPNHGDELEFLSIKVPGGPLTSQLQNIAPGQDLIVSNKPVGTLVMRDLRPGRTLYLLATGTGLAPFLSIIQDPETYEKFERVVIAHGVRTTQELAYADFISKDLPRDPYLGEEIAAKLLYYPAVTREPFRTMGRLTSLMASGQMTADLGLPDLDPALDRAMICGSAAMLSDMSTLLDERGFEASPGIGEPGDYVIERAFAER
ncbi:ferredoxin--NADP reductase [Sphingomonas sp. ZT3P38]|uniref:ferredoxin--NADP reductase n=1 Tax=Parasphingomonas zepuensis TaxID=3096161 RepID=UPI002FCB9901